MINVKNLLLTKSTFWRTISTLIVMLTISSLFFSSPLKAFAAGDVGYKTFSYSGATAPTGQKPQSKLWFNDGIWWGSLFNKSTLRFEIYRFNWSTNAWATTGTVIDARRQSAADALWDGSSLYVVSAVPPGTKGDVGIKVMHYTYNPSTKTYTLASGFPVTLASKAIETVVIDKDTTGQLWVTYTDDNTSGGRNVYITHTTSNDRTWVTPYVLQANGANNLDIDDISTLVAYNGKIGVMWSNQTNNTVYFASHKDGDPDNAWTLNPALQGPKYADDHLNIKSLQADPSGQVFAAVKTSLNDVNPSTSSEPLVLLLTLDNNGSWSRRTFGRVSDDHTRPIVLLDNENRQIYVFATIPVGSATSGAIYYKSVSLDNSSMQFSSGVGIPFMSFALDTHINNASSTKQALNGTTDLLVIAGDDTSKYYFHNRFDLPSSAATATPSSTPTAINSPTVTNTPTSTNTPTNTPTLTPSYTPLPSDTPTLTPTPSNTPLPTDTPTVTPTPAVSSTALPSNTPTFTPTPSNTPMPTNTPTATPTPADSPTPLPSNTPTFTPTPSNTPVPTDTPTAAFTPTPTNTPSGSGAQVLFSDGFENGNFSAWSQVAIGGDGTAFVQSSSVSTGIFAASLSATINTGSNSYIRKSLNNAETDLRTSLDIQITQEGLSGSNVPILRLYDPAGTRILSLYRQNLDSNRVWVSHSGTRNQISLLPLNTWSHFEVHAITSGTSSTLEIWQDNTLVFSTITASLGTSGILTIQVGYDTTKQQFALNADNVLVTR